MKELYYNDILLNDENIIKLAVEDKIDENFPYLDNASVMIPAIKVKPELLKISGRSIMWSMDKIFKSDISDDIKKECLYNSLAKMNNFPESVAYLLDDEEFLIKLVSKDILLYIMVLSIKSNDIMEEIFHRYYEDIYRYNPDYVISYALKSPKVLMRDLENGGYYCHMFDISAYDDKIIDYIIAHKMFASKLDKMYSIPRILVAKLALDPNFIYEMNGSNITKEVVDYLKEKNIEIDMTKFSEHYVVSPEFLMAILDISMDNIHYLHDSKSLNDSVIIYLVNHNYAFKDGDFIELLNYDDIIKSTVLNGNLDYIVMHNIALSDNMVDFIVNYVKKNNYDIKIISNNCLAENKKFNDYLTNKYKLKNVFNLPISYAVSNMARSINEEFIKYFSYDVAYRIIDQIVLNDYYIDLESIFNNITVSKYKEMYDKICYKCFSSNKFDFYFFIKFSEYFANNLALLNDLNNKELNDNVLDNLSLAINNNDKVNNYEELMVYRESYRKKIITSNLELKDKICYLLINGNMIDADHFLHNVLNKLDAIYMQLEYQEGSYEYNYLESCLNLIDCLNQVLAIDDEKTLLKILSDIVSKYELNACFNKEVLETNIRNLYSRMYSKRCLNKEKLSKKGKCEEIDGVLVYHLEGEDFALFSHRLDFNKDSYDVDVISSLFEDRKERDDKFANYVCTTYETMFSNFNMNDDSIPLYEIDDDTDLLAFGNMDIYINHTKKPLFTANSNYLNPIDMTYFSKSFGYTPTEFDLLRKKGNSSIKTPSYITCNYEKIDSMLSLAKRYNIPIVCFDREKNKKILQQMYVDYCLNLDNLNYQDIYKLIRLSVSEGNKRMDDELLSSLYARISCLSVKEQMLLEGKLMKYGYNISKYKDKENNPRK